MEVRRQDRRPESVTKAKAYAVALLLIAACGSSTVDGAAEPSTDARIANGWRTLRVVDCARCHGRNYTGLAAPSLVGDAIRDRAMFERMVLDGDPVRGMPGYRGNAFVVENLDDIYAYLRARAAGDVSSDYRPLAGRR